MKCVKVSNKIQRVSDKEAEVLVASGGHYVPKEIWKKEVRDIKKKVTKKEE